MKSPQRWIRAALLIFMLSTLSALPGMNDRSAFSQDADPVPLQQALTPTPPAQGVDEIGSTDGILLMGFVIALIIILPLFFRKKGK
jgi:hypothetical protein